MRKPSLTVLVIAGALLAGCGGGSEADPEADPTSTAAPSPTTADFEEAHALYHDLGTVLDDAAQGAADFQAAVLKAWKKDPKRFGKDPEAATRTAIEEQQGVVAAREAALTELAEHPAMADEELAASYQTFHEQYDVAMDYQDGYHDSYPVLLVTNDACAAVQEMRDVIGLTPEMYAENWLREHGEVAAPCRAGAARLASSTNEDVVALATAYTTWMDDREAPLELVRKGKLTIKQASARLQKANDAMDAAVNEHAGFSDTLAELMPTEEYAAVDTVFEDRVGETGSASPSPSASTSE